MPEFQLHQQRQLWQLILQQWQLLLQALQVQAFPQQARSAWASLSTLKNHGQLHPEVQHPSSMPLLFGAPQGISQHSDPLPHLSPRKTFMTCPRCRKRERLEGDGKAVAKKRAGINILGDVCTLFSLLIYSLALQLQLLFPRLHLVWELKKNILFVCIGPQVRLACSEVCTSYVCTCEFNKVCCLFKLCCCLLNCREVGSCHYARIFLIEV